MGTVPASRDQRRGDDPQTPDVRTKCSKRCFDGLLRSWRRRLHRYDPPSEHQEGQEDGKADQDLLELRPAGKDDSAHVVTGVRGAPERQLEVGIKRSSSPDAASFATPGTPTAMVRSLFLDTSAIAVGVPAASLCG